LAIQAHDAGLGQLDTGPNRAATWATLLPLMLQFWHRVGLHVATRHRAGRLKQWLNYLRRSYPQAQQAFDDVRLLHDPVQVEQWLQQAIQSQSKAS
jgi:tRNA-dihydrouridine synthase C